MRNHAIRKKKPGYPPPRTTKAAAQVQAGGRGPEVGQHYGNGHDRQSGD